MKKVNNSRKVDLTKLKKALLTAMLAITMGVVAAPSVTVRAEEEEILFEDNSSEDVNLEDAETPAPQDTKPAEEEAKPAEEAAPVVEQQNNPETEKKSEEQVNDGTVDTSKDTNPEDAKKDHWNGDNNDYFDEWNKDEDPDPKAGEYIDSEDELHRKHLVPDEPTPPTPPTPPEPDQPEPDQPQPDQPQPSQPTPAPTQPTPAPATPKPVAKTGDAGTAAVAGIAGIDALLLGLYAAKRRLLAMKRSEEVVGSKGRTL